MTDKAIEWMANELSSKYRGAGRTIFLRILKYNRDLVVTVFSQLIEGLPEKYKITTGSDIVMLKDPEDANAYVTLARRIVGYMCDEALRNELAHIR